MAIFDEKTWNDAVFQKYLQKIPNVKVNSMLKNGVLKENNSLKARLVDGVGGNTLIEPIKGLLDGDVINYDGSTDITATSRDTYSQRKIVCGRAKAWVEKDFSNDLTGEKWMSNLASEVSEYYDDVDQDDVLAVLKGVFGMQDVKGQEFVSAHTTDISSASTATVGATTLNNAIQKASGDKKSIFKLAFMHSIVATNLENLQLLDYLKYTDADGIQRDLGMATWNGRLVIIDDDMPVTTTVSTHPVYSTTISTAAVATDTITIAGITYTFVANDATDTATQIKVGAAGTAAQQAVNIAAKLNAASSGIKDDFTIAASSTKVTFTGKSDSVIEEQPEVSVDSADTIKITNAEDTAGVSSTTYTTYVLGDGAIEYCNVGAAVPSEMNRNPATNGGQTTLYTRQRKLYAPKWISWIGENSIISPTAAQLGTGTNWEIVNDGAASNKSYVNHKSIPMARIISKG